jgi:ankyrin repeat protein
MSMLSNLNQPLLPERLPQIKKKILSDKANLIQNFSMKSQIPTEVKLKAIIESLLVKGVNPNARDSGNWTPVHIAAKGQNTKTLHWMLSLNRELEKRGMNTFDFSALGGTKNWSPLHVASYTGCFAVIQELIENSGHDIFCRSANNKLPR